MLCEAFDHGIATRQGSLKFSAREQTRHLAEGAGINRCVQLQVRAVLKGDEGITIETARWLTAQHDRKPGRIRLRDGAVQIC
jgi:hypothetical protein